MIDIDIYYNQIVSFFNNNPNDLISLIGEDLKEDFFKKIKEQCYINYNNGEDIMLTKDQIIDIVLSLKEGTSDVRPIVIGGLFQKTDLGFFSLN